MGCRATPAALRVQEMNDCSTSWCAGGKDKAPKHVIVILVSFATQNWDSKTIRRQQRRVLIVVPRFTLDQSSTWSTSWQPNRARHARSQPQPQSNSRLDAKKFPSQWPRVFGVVVRFPFVHMLFIVIN